jgi:predicted Zn-dependent protease
MQTVEDGLRALGARPVVPPLEVLRAMDAPREDSWLWTEEEDGESVAEYAARLARRRRSRGWAARSTLYLQCVGEEVVAVEKLARFAGAFLQMRVEVLPRLAVEVGEVGEAAVAGDTAYAWAEVGGEAVAARFFLKKGKGKGREVVKERRQLHIGETVLRLARGVPADGVAVLGVCSEDLYCEEEDLFQMGLGDKTKRAGVVSVARYTPRARFDDATWHSLRLPTREALREEERAEHLRRVAGTLVHEALHTLHLEHCVWWRCLMNGSGSLREDAEAPLHLCPVCLAKLALATGCDVRARARDLIRAAGAVGIPVDPVWTRVEEG